MAPPVTDTRLLVILYLECKGRMHERHENTQEDMLRTMLTGFLKCLFTPKTSLSHFFGNCFILNFSQRLCQKATEPKALDSELPVHRGDEGNDPRYQTTTHATSCYVCYGL